MLVLVNLEPTKQNRDLQFCVIKRFFDSIWLQEALNDPYDSVITSRDLDLLHEGNKLTEMCVERSFGRSDYVKLKKLLYKAQSLEVLYNQIK